MPGNVQTTRVETDMRDHIRKIRRYVWNRRNICNRRSGRTNGGKWLRRTVGTNGPVTDDRNTKAVASRMPPRLLPGVWRRFVLIVGPMWNVRENIDRRGQLSTTDIDNQRIDRGDENAAALYVLFYTNPLVSDVYNGLRRYIGEKSIPR